MTENKTTCRCPSCGHELSLDELKVYLPEAMLKSLWASYGSRQRRGRVISPDQQQKMQAARQAAAAERVAE